MADPTLELQKDRSTREKIEALGAKAKRVEGLKSLRIGKKTSEREPLRLTKNDLAALKVPEQIEEPEVDATQRETWLSIVSTHFADGYKWRFSDGGERPFTATIEDPDFQNSVMAGDIQFSANDALRCLVREEQTLTGTGLSKVIFIERVIEHRIGATQLKLM